MFFLVKYTERFHPGVKLYRFEPRVKDACKQKIFHPNSKSHLGVK